MHQLRLAHPLTDASAVHTGGGLAALQRAATAWGQAAVGTSSLECTRCIYRYAPALPLSASTHACRCISLAPGTAATCLVGFLHVQPPRPPLPQGCPFNSTRTSCRTSATRQPLLPAWRILHVRLAHFCHPSAAATCLVVPSRQSPNPSPSALSRVTPPGALQPAVSRRRTRSV